MASFLTCVDHEIQKAPTAGFHSKGDTDGGGWKEQAHDARVDRGDAEVGRPSPHSADRARAHGKKRLARRNE
jgi:hypothetical protein